MKSILKVFLVTTLIVGVVFSLGAAKKTKYTKDAWLGVITQSVNDEIADAFDLSVDYGAIINEVIADSPAEEAELEEGDIIVGFNNEKIYDSDDLIDLIEDNRPSDNVTITIIRDGDTHKVEVTLDRKPRHNKSKQFYGIDLPQTPPVPPTPPLIGKSFDNFSFIINGGSYIGVRLTDLSNQLREYFGVKEDIGVLVTEVDKDTPAEKAGLKAGDIIIRVDDEEISVYGDVKEMIEEKDKGEKVNITVVRDKKEKDFEVEIVERDDDSFENVFYFNTPDIKLRIPKMKGLFNSEFSDDWEAYFDTEELPEVMEDLYDELEELKKELKSIKLKYKKNVKEQLEELHKELKELREKID